MRSTCWLRSTPMRKCQPRSASVTNRFAMIGCQLLVVAAAAGMLACASTKPKQLVSEDLPALAGTWEGSIGFGENWRGPVRATIENDLRYRIQTAPLELERSWAIPWRMEGILTLEEAKYEAEMKECLRARGYSDL